MEDYSLGDIMTLVGSKENTGFNFGGVGGLILILLFFFIFGGNGFGFNGNQNSLTNLERDVLNGNSTINQNILKGNYDTLLNFKDMQGQMSSCCCDIKTAIHADGEATRALITQNRIADLENQLNIAQTSIANAVQTQNILGSLGRYYTNPSVNPYYAYQSAFNGTTLG